jgi:predicted transposase YbfD/YdcC
MREGPRWVSRLLACDGDGVAFKYKDYRAKGRARQNVMRLAKGEFIRRFLKGREPLHLVSAWASRQRLVLGQEAVDAKSNEIVAIPLLLERLELKGALVTIDAMGTQTDIAEKIVARGGDYPLALKANRPLLHQDVATFFDAPPRDMLEPPHETTDGDHGRLEQRRHVVCHKVDWLFSDRRYADEPRFPHLSMIGMIESRVERNGVLARERRYYLSSTKLDAETFAAAVRAHWGVENRLHWVLDGVFHDDLARPRSGNGPQNMAVVKHMATNLVRDPKDKHSLKVRRKKANLNPNYLETLIRQTPALI